MRTPALLHLLWLAAVIKALQGSKCGQECYQNQGTCNEELRRCDCPSFRSGNQCEVVVSRSEPLAACSNPNFQSSERCQRSKRGWGCINGCNGRGSCIRGFCHCHIGHFGADCSLSLDDQGMPQILQGTSYRTREKRPWIYVYEIPPEFNTLQALETVDRPTLFHFWGRLLTSGARTADPQKADFFFIPMYLRGSYEIRNKFSRAMYYVKSTWPYYNSSHSGSHFVLETGDWGKMDAGFQLRHAEYYSKLTWLTHWGIYNNSKKEHWKVAHDPLKDIVIPVFNGPGRLPMFGHDRSPLHPRAYPVPTKNKTFFHAGRICGERRPPNASRPWPYNCQESRIYSGGVRQMVHSFHHDRPGFVVSVRAHDFSMQMRTSKFCLSTQGGGHGNRQVLMALAGCALVSIGEGIYEPFEPEMDYSTFGVKLSVDKIPELHKILASISKEEYARKQVALKCAAQHLHYSGIVGGLVGESGRYDAFETALEILRMRADYPNTPPQDYTKVDPAFKRFMACGAANFGDVPPPEPKGVVLCSRSIFDAVEKRCGSCSSRRPGPVTVPVGGAICCNAPNLAECPRNWD